MTAVSTAGQLHTGASAHDTAGKDGERQPTKRTEWERYGVIPLAIFHSELSLAAKVIYGYLDAIQGTTGRPAKGIGHVASETHMARNTLKSALLELEAAGLIVASQRLSVSGKASRATEFRVIHNPVRKRYSGLSVTLPTGTGKDGKPRGGRTTTPPPGSNSDHPPLGQNFTIPPI